MELQLARSLRILHHVLLKVGLILYLGLLKLRFPNVIRPRIILIIFLFALYLSTFYYLLSVSIYFLLIFISLPIYCYLSSWVFFVYIFYLDPCSAGSFFSCDQQKCLPCPRLDFFCSAATLQTALFWQQIGLYYRSLRQSVSYVSSNSTQKSPFLGDGIQP